MIAGAQEGGPASAGSPDFLTCSWCTAPATGPVQGEPERFGYRKGIKVLVARAIVVPACRDHATIADGQPPVAPRARRRKPGPDQLTIEDM